MLNNIEQPLFAITPVDYSRGADLTFPLLKAQRYITQLKSQINSLEAELEEQRAQKQRALVENEQLRMELEATRRRNAEHESLQTTFIEAESTPCSQFTLSYALTACGQTVTLSSLFAVQKDRRPLSSGTIS